MNRWLVGVVMAVALIQTGGCSEVSVSVSGKTAKDVFQDPQTLALVKAACHGDIPKIDALVKQGANVNATGYRDMTPLVWTMECKNYAGIKKLLELGANPNYKMEGDISAMWASAGSSDPHFLPLMLAHGGDPNIRSGYQTALMIAIEQGRVENINLLIKAGVDLNAHNAVGFSAADAALAAGRLDYIVKLLENGYSYQLQQLANGLVSFGMSSPYYSYKLSALALLAKKGVRPKPAVPHIIPPPPGIK